MTKDIVACSTQRSGHNAILKWLLYQNENVNEFREWELGVAFASAKENEQYIQEYVQVNTGSIEYGSYVATEVINPTLKFSRQYKYNKKKGSSDGLTPTCLVWNFVDIPISEILDVCNFCKNIVDPIIIVIIRDWRNYIASHIKHWENADGTGDPVWNRVRPDAFKEYADYFLDESPYYPILFDAWFSNKEYRVKICEDLGLHFTDIGKQGVAHFGGGSSFDLQKFDGKAEKMNVLNRYKLYKDNEQYKRFMEDEEAVELNNRILEKYL